MKVKLLKIWLVTLLSSLYLFSFSANRYWVGGSGNWSESSHWASESNGIGGVSVPSATDNVLIDSKSFSTTGQSITISGTVVCNNLTWSETVFNPELIGKGSSLIQINGSISITDTFIDSFLGTIDFVGSSENQIYINGKLNANLMFNGLGSWILNSDITTLQNIKLQSGTLKTNNYQITANTFDGNGTKLRGLLLGNSVITVNSWLFGTTQNLTFEGGKSKIIVLGDWSTSLQHGDLVYGMLTNSDKRALSFTTSVAPYTCDKTGLAKGKITVTASGVIAPVQFILYKNGVILQAKKTATTLVFTVDSLMLDPSLGNTYTIDVIKGASTINRPVAYPGTWPAQMQVGISVVKQVTCALESCDAKLSADPIGGVAPYSYKWLFTGNQTTKIATGVCNNISLACEVTDANSCVTTGTINYYPGQPGYTGPRQFVFNPDPVANTPSCGSQNNGTISIKMQGGLGPRQFKLVSASSKDNRPYQSDSNFANLITGETYTIWAKDSVGCEKKATNDITIAAIAEPIVNAGVDTTICADLTVLNGNVVATNCSTTLWTTSGDGKFSDKTKASPVYTPGSNDVSTGSVVLTITATGLAGCSNVTDSRTISISPLPTVFAGPDQSVCLTSLAYPLSGATVANESLISWTSKGDGTFSDATKLQPTYTFKTADTTSKSATVVLSVHGSGGCGTRVVTDSLNFTMTVPPFVYAGVDQNMCKGNTYSASDASIHYFSSIIWSTSGNGTFSSTSIEQPIYTPSTADKAAGSVTLTAKAIAKSPCVDDQKSITLTFFDPPVISAGPDTIVCSNGAFTVSKATKNYINTLQWSTSGDGTFDDKTKINPIYIPGTNDNTLGSVTLTVTGIGNGGCSTVTVTDNMSLTMVDSAFASAGISQSICKGSELGITTATAKNYSILAWTSSGSSGTLSSATTLNTKYTPSTADKAAGSVTLTLTAKGINPCPDYPSAITITLSDQPVIELGPDKKVCSNGIYDLGATTGGFYNTLQWTRTGDGSFDNDKILQPKYTPGTADNTNNSVMLKLEATGTGGCSAMKVRDSLTVQFIDSAFASAGANPRSTCKGSSITFSTASAQNYSALDWTSTGTGLFSIPTAISTDYTPSSGDIALPSPSSVKITLTAKGNAPCPDYSSQITLNLNDQPTVFAGNDTTVCSKASYTLATATENYNNTRTWSTPNGDGSFSSTSTLHSIYSPGDNDKSTGSVLLVLNVTGKLTCSAVQKADTVLLTMNDPPVVNAGATMDICNNKLITISDATASNYASLLWTTPTSGSFSDKTNVLTSYVPDASDLTNGSVVLTLTAKAKPSCNDAQSQKTINLYKPVTATSGGSKTVCFNSSYTFVDDDAKNYKTLTWEKTAADGSFSSTNSLHPTYTLGPNDLIAGFALLNLKATGSADCDPVSSSMTLTIDKGPQIDAGTDIEICYNGKATLASSTAKAGTYTSLAWTSDGNGTFDNANSLHPVYAPGSADLIKKTVKLTLTALGTSACKNALDSLTVTILPQLTVAVNSGGTHPYSTKCYGGWDAEAHVKAVGGTSPYAYVWNGPDITGQDTLLRAGTFVASVTDSKGCVVSNSIVITEPTEIKTSFTLGTPIKCNGDATASVTVNPTNGVGAYTYIWSNGDNVATATSLNAGKKYITVTDGNSCNVIDSIVITQPTKVKSAFINKLPNCPGDADGSIISVPSGGTVTSGYSYRWSNIAWTVDSTRDRIVGLSTGIFGVTVKDNNNCSFDTTFVLPNPKPLAVAFDITNVKCYGDSTGQIIAHVTGGSKPYSYMWTDINNSTDSILKKLTITSLQVDIYDANNCELFSPVVTVTQPPVFSVGVGKPTSFLISATTKITVSFKGKHDMIQDVGFNLIAPDGTVVKLSTSPSTAGSPNPACNVGRNFNINFTTEASATLNMCAIHPYGSPSWPASWTDNNRIGWPENPAILGDFKPETPWDSIYGQDPSNGGWALEILDCFPLKVAEVLDSSVWENASLSFTDKNTTTNLLETITFQKSGMNTQIKNPVAAGCESTKFKIPLKLSTSCYGLCDAEGIMNPVGGIAPYSYSWSSPSIPNKDTLMLCAGSYTVTATDANGCTSVGGVNIIQPAKISANLDSVNNKCYGLATGRAVVKVDSGGVAPFKYLWSNVATTTTTTNLAGGKYYLTITDANNCHQVDSIIVRDSLKVLANITIDSALCTSSAEGAIHLAPFGENMITKGGYINRPYSYLWQTPLVGVDSSLKSLSSGTYTMTVVDASGCRLDTTATVFAPLPLSFGGTVSSPPTCSGRNDASIILSVSGSTKPYSYKWTNPDSLRDRLESIKAGTYNVTVTDKNGCSKDTTFIITDPVGMIPTITATDSVKCFGDANAMASVSVVNGMAPYSYEWSTGSLLDNISGLVAGDYSVTVSDKYKCSVSDKVTIKEPKVLTLSTSIIDSVSCNGLSDGQFKVSTIGGSKPYSFTWNNLESDSVVKLAKAGSYFVTVTDVKGCFDTKSVLLPDPDVLKATTVAINKSISCDGRTDGSGTVNIIGGTKPYGILWSNAKITSFVENLAPNTYTVTVTDGHGCTSTTNLIIDQTKILSASIDSVHNISCHLINDGLARVLATGGAQSAGYSYLWSNNAIAPQISVLTAGKYTVTVSDTSNCQVVISQVITKDIFTATFENTKDVLCHNTCTGSSNFSANKLTGKSPYTYTWENGETDSLAKALCAGTTNVTVTDKNGCVYSDKVVINDLVTSLAVSYDTVYTPCGLPQGKAIAHVSGGVPAYSYKWSNGVLNSSNLNIPVGVYNLTITDVNGCKLNSSVEIADTSVMPFATKTVDVWCIPCSGKAIVYNTDPTDNQQYSYKWSTGSINDTLYNACLGLQTVKVTRESDLCVNVFTDSVKKAKGLDIAMHVLTPRSCAYANDASAYVSYTDNKGPVTYQWSNGSTDSSAVNLPSGTHFVTVTDGTCTLVDSIVFVDPISPIVKMSSTTVSCYQGSDGSATLTMLNALVPDSIIWNDRKTNPQKTAKAITLPYGMYTATVYYNNTCIFKDSVQVDQNPKLTVTWNVTNTICNSDIGQIIAKGKGGVPFVDSVINYKYKYRWHALGMDSIKLPQYDNDTITGLGVDYYVLQVTDSLKCSFTSPSILLTDNGDITSSVDSIRFPTCPTINNGYYRIKPKSINPPFSYGFWKYNTTITDSVGAWWQPSYQTSTMGIADSLTPGSYKVYITNDPTKNCKQVVLFTIGTNYLTANITKQDVTCPLHPDGMAVVAGSQGLPYLHKPKYRYLWSNGSTNDSIKGLTPGTYSVTVTDSISCPVVRAVTINNPIMMTVTLPSDTVQTLCYGTTATTITATVTGGQSPYIYTWDGVASGASLIAGTSTKWHYITVNDTGCFVAKDSIYIEQKGHIKLDSVNNPKISCGKSDGKLTLHVDATSKPLSFLWNNGVKDSINDNLPVGYYSYTVTDAQNCIISDTITLVDSSDIAFKVVKDADVHCAGLAIGAAHVNIADVTGGTPSYTKIIWNNEDYLYNTDNRWQADTLRSGIVEVRVIDSKGCTGLNRVRISADNVLKAVFTNVVNDVSCPSSPTYTGSVKIDAANGKIPYKFIWNTKSPSQILNNLASGTYTVTITDQNSCIAIDSVAILHSPLTVDSVKQINVSCYGLSNGSIEVVAKNGLKNAPTYTWSNGQSAALATGLSLGKYYVTITETSNACIAVDTFEVVQPQKISVAYTTLKKTSCKDSTGIVKATMSGGIVPYSYVWKGFVKPDTLSITDTIRNYWAEYFQLSVKDANGCPFVDTMRTTDTSSLVVNPLKMIPVSCYGLSDGYLSVEAKGGVGKCIYSWKHDATIQDSIAKDLKSGIYTVRVTDDSTCWRDYVAKIVEPDTLVMTFPYPTKISCYGGSDTVSVHIIGGNSGNLVSWEKGAVALAVTDTIIPDAKIGIYHVSVLDSKGCKADSSVVITQANKMTLDSLVVNAGCGISAASGSAKIMSITSDYLPVTFKWWDDTLDSLHGHLSKGSYNVIVTDAKKCIDTLSIVVKSEMFDSVRIDTVQMAKCNYNSPTGTLAAHAYGSVLPYSWQWSRSVADINDTVKKLLPGKYYLTVTGKNGCTISDSAVVTPMVDIEAVITTKTNNSAVSTIHFCKNDSTTLVGVNTKRSIHYNGIKPAKNERFTWGVKDGNTDELLATMSNNVGSEISVKPFQPTTYQMWYSLYGCSVPVREVSLSYYDTIGLTIDIVKDDEILHDTTTIVKGYKLQLQPHQTPWFVDKDSSKVGFIQYNWNSYDTLMKLDGVVLRKILNEADYLANNKTMALQVSPSQSTWYVVEGKTNYGCYERDSVKITVQPGFTIPSGISPNGDGINDKWNLPYLKQYPDARVSIFNRWGIIVWEKNKEYNSAPFEGKNKDGKELPLGTYYYLIEFNDNGVTPSSSGSITIVR